MTATRLTLAVAALAAGTFVLTACEPVNSSSGTGGGTTCDPNGWGPLSGCDNTDTGSSPELEQAPPAQAVDQQPTRTSENTATTSAKVSAPEHNVTVNVTWIVVSIDVTGIRECVISLREAPPSFNDHFSRRITTPEDCEAQQVDAVYRPVDE